jgi:hypothetical protein
VQAEQRVIDMMNEKARLEKKIVDLRKEETKEAEKIAKPKRIQALRDEIAFLDEQVKKRQAIANMKIPEIIAKRKEDEAAFKAKEEEGARIAELRKKLQIRGIRAGFQLGDVTPEQLKGLKKKDREFIKALQERLRAQRQAELDRAQKLAKEELLKKQLRPDIKELQKITKAVEGTEKKLAELLIRR